jgi:hypothetical protein
MYGTSVNEMAVQNVRILHKSLCDETFICVQSRVLAGETFARAPDGRIGNYRPYIILVFQENQGHWQMNHECVAHIWLTANEEYVVFIPCEG